MESTRETMMLRAEIVGVVAQAMKEANEQKNEKYVSGDELGQFFSFFTRSWLRYYGHLLPRERVCVVMEDGETRTTGWGYPLHEIQRMVREGSFRVLEYKAAMRDKE